jgi:acetolactate synthase I/II/III large subunit
VHRALQIARSEPAGPVSLVAALTQEVTAEIATALAGARHPLIVTTYLGRNPAAVPSLVGLAELHAGFQYYAVAQSEMLAEADVVLVIDSDVPWIPR